MEPNRRNMQNPGKPAPQNSQEQKSTGNQRQKGQKESQSPEIR